MWCWHLSQFSQFQEARHGFAIHSASKASHCHGLEGTSRTREGGDLEQHAGMIANTKTRENKPSSQVAPFDAFTAFPHATLPLNLRQPTPHASSRHHETETKIDSLDQEWCEPCKKAGAVAAFEVLPFQQQAAPKGSVYSFVRVTCRERGTMQQGLGPWKSWRNFRGLRGEPRAPAPIAVRKTLTRCRRLAQTRAKTKPWHLGSWHPCAVVPAISTSEFPAVPPGLHLRPA